MQTCYYTHLPYPEQHETGTRSGDEASRKVTLDFASASWLEQSVCADVSEVLALDPVVPVQLDRTIELNRQLRARLQKKQEVISALKQKNAQLKELAKHTGCYNTTLDACVRVPGWHRPSAPRLGECREPARGPPQPGHHTPVTLCSRAERPGRAGACRQPDVKRLKPERELRELDAEETQCRFQHTADEPPPSRGNRHPHPPGTGTVTVFGAFDGYQVVTASPDLSADCAEKEAVWFKTSVREHSTIRTRVFCHGRTFTTHAPDGGCRFLWVPCEK